MDFWDRFVQLCKEKNVSQRQACKDMGLSPSASAKAINAGTKPSYDFLVGCARYFGVSVDSLLGIEKAAPENEGGGLSDKQKEIIRLIHGLTDQQAAFLLSQVKGLISGL